MISFLIAMLAMMVPVTQTSGRIAGSVYTTGDQGRPLGRAYVSLVSVDPAVRRLTMTRDDGTFVFDGLSPGTYVIEAGKLPYLATSARLTVMDGQRVDSLVLRLKRSGVIAGQVFNDDGQPAWQATVSAYRLRIDRGGAMSAVPTGHSAVSDRWGRFRIHGLPPGAYAVATSMGPRLFEFGIPLTDADVDRAMQGNAGPRPIVAPPTVPLELQTVPVFVPGVTQPEAATPFVIDDGTEYLNISALLTLTTSPLTTAALTSITGSVVGPDGQPTSARVTLARGPVSPGPGVGYRSSNTSATRFAFHALAPGPVRLEAAVPGQNLRAAVDLTASGGQISDVTLRLSPPIDVRGHATHGAAQPVGRRIVVRALSGAPAETGVDSDSDSGAFHLSLFPGRYVVESGSSVTIDGRDMTDRVIEITPEAPIRNLVVDFSEHVQDISGRVTNTDGTGVNTVTMVAFSTVASDWFDQSKRIRIAKPAADGRYQLGGAGEDALPAGAYHLAAVADLSPDAQYNPTFLRTLVDSAISVTVTSGHRTVQDVRVR